MTLEEQKPEFNHERTKVDLCKAGEKLERDFVGRAEVSGWGVAMNPQKQTDPYAVDLLACVPVDLKVKRTPWKKSQSMFGIPSDYALTVDMKDLKRYGEIAPNVLIVIDAQFSEKSRGLYLLTLPRARWLLKNDRAKRFTYPRLVGKGEQKQSDTYVTWECAIFDLRDLDRLKT